MGQVLITLTQAKKQVRAEDFTDDDSDLLLKMEEASDIVLGYVTNTAKAGWTDRTAPARIRTATLLVLAHLYANRGDDGAAADPLSAPVTNLLRRDRDPSLA